MPVDKLGFKGDQRHSVMKAFDVSLLKPLVAVYTALNNELEGKGVQEGGAASSYKPTGFRNTMIGQRGCTCVARPRVVGQAPVR